MPKTLRTDVKHYFIIKIPGKREVQQIALNHLSDIEFKNFMKPYKDYSKEPFSFLVSNTTLPLDNSLQFRKNLLQKMTVSKKKKI